jgi:hypothetical protein
MDTLQDKSYGYLMTAVAIAQSTQRSSRENPEENPELARMYNKAAAEERRLWAELHRRQPYAPLVIRRPR